MGREGYAGCQVQWDAVPLWVCLPPAPPRELPRGAADAEPITIGFAEALTGSLAAVGKSGVLAMQIWAEDITPKADFLAAR